MGKRRLLFLLTEALLILSFAACEEENTTKVNEKEDPTDYTWDTSTVVQITLDGTSITVDPSVANVSGSKVTITDVGTYSIQGTLTDGQVIVDSKDEGNIRLILNGANITCSNSAPIYILDAKKIIINLADGTQNYLTDGTTYVTEEGEPNAALFSNAYLSIFGNGSLTVTAKYNDGISTDDGLIIKSGNISVSATDDGIRGKDYLIINSGYFTINAKGDGMKSDNEDDNTLGYILIDSATANITSSADGITAKTNLTIKDGSYTIKTGGGAPTTISTGGGGGGMKPPGGGTSGGYTGTVSAKALKALSIMIIEKGTFNISSADDAIHSNDAITIDGGTFSIATGDDVIHADASITINGGDLDISKSYEGIESASITFNDGNLILTATDDGFNATKGSATESNDGSSACINGGYVVVNCSSGDGLDSNGNFTIQAGTVIVHGPQSQPEVGFDINGTFDISGGFFIATGPNSGNMIEVPSSSSSQYSVKVTIQSNLSSTTLFHIQDASGNELVTYKPVRNVYYVVFSSENLVNGSSYSIYTGGSSTGIYSNGLYTGGTYTGGTLKKTFTISGKTTSVSI
jgi:hypothetical protein